MYGYAVTQARSRHPSSESKTRSQFWFNSAELTRQSSWCHRTLVSPRALLGEGSHSISEPLGILKLVVLSTFGRALNGSFSGEAQYQLTYPMPVLQALIDEAHRLGKKTACHVYGGEGQKNTIIAGCDTIEHAFGLDQEQADMMVKKRYTTIRH